MMAVVLNPKITLEKEKIILEGLKELIKKDTNEKDRKYHQMAIIETEKNIKRLEGIAC